MTMYAMSDVHSITIPNGCGESHSANPDTWPGERMSVECPDCEQILMATPSLGWSNHPGGAKLTPDEIGQGERDEEAAKRYGVNAAARAMSGNYQTTPQPSLIQQIAQMNDEEKAALRTLLGSDTSGTTVLNKGADVGGNDIKSPAARTRKTVDAG